MARKKNKVSGKKKVQVKKNTSASKNKANNLSLAESIAKDFRHVPTKLAALFKKDLVAAKQQEKKLKTELKKVQAQNKIAKAKQLTLSKKSGKANAKQIAAVKKTLDQSNIRLSKLFAEIDLLNKLAHSLTQNQTKYQIIGKELIKLEKELDAKAALKKAPKAKATKKPSPAKRKKTTVNIQSEELTQTSSEPLLEVQEEVMELEAPEAVEISS